MATELIFFRSRWKHFLDFFAALGLLIAIRHFNLSNLFLQTDYLKNDPVFLKNLIYLFQLFTYLFFDISPILLVLYYFYKFLLSLNSVFYLALINEGIVVNISRIPGQAKNIFIPWQDIDKISLFKDKNSNHHVYFAKKIISFQVKNFQSIKDHEASQMIHAFIEKKGYQLKINKNTVEYGKQP